DRRIQEFLIGQGYPPKDVVITVHQAIRAHRATPGGVPVDDIVDALRSAHSRGSIEAAIRVLDRAGVVRRAHTFENRSKLRLIASAARIERELGTPERAREAALLERLRREFG